MRKISIFLCLTLVLILMVSVGWSQEFERPRLMADISDNIGPVRPPMNNPGVDAQWDLVFWFDAQTPVADAYLLGCEYAGGHFYITAGSSYGGIAPNNRVFVYDATGAIVDTFDQWSTVGGWGWRDIAYDGTYLYAADDNTVDAFDLAGNPVPASNITVTPPTGGAFPRALAYDPATDHFWCGNFGSTMYEFTRAGAVVWSGAPAPLVAIYGMAWDDAGPGGPWLWIHDQSPEAAGPNGATIYQFNPTTHVFTGVSYNVPYIGGATSQLAGGLAFTDEHIPGFYTLIGITQGTPTDNLFELEMYPSANPSAPGAPTAFTVNNNGATLTASLQWTNPTVTASGGVLTSIDSVVVERDGSVVRTYTSVTPGQVMSYNNTVPSAGMYSFTVYAVNDSGNGISDTESEWIGLDAPGAVTSLTGAGVGELLQAQLNWVNPVVGAHGGYFPAGSIDSYTINRYGTSATTFNVLGLQTGYLDNTIPVRGEYWYGVIPTNSTGSGPEILTSHFVVGPSMHGAYDIGGGAAHYPTIIAAVADLVAMGMTAPVTFNVYNGTYAGQINIPNTISGLGAANPLTIRAVPGQNPIVTSTGHGFYITGADYVTIRGLEIANCSYNGIYVYPSSTDSSYNIRVIGNYIHHCGTSVSYYGIHFYYYCANSEIRMNEVHDCWVGIGHRKSDNGIIANNMVYNLLASAGYGIYQYGLACYAGSKIYHNSVYVTQGYAFYYNQDLLSNVYDNIFYQAGTGSYYAFRCLTNAPTHSDYNDLYAPNAYVGYITSNLTTLADWQAATGGDAHSISANPLYVSATNLHIVNNIPSPVDGIGIPVPEVTVDIDGEPRDPVHPDIGADEFELIVMHYCVVLTPETSTGEGEPPSTVDHMFVVNNCGAYNDAYNLSVTVTGQPWTHTIKNSTGTTTIDSIVVNAGQVDSFLVRVNIPAGVSPGATSTGQVIARSRRGVDDILADTSTTTTTAVVILAGEYDIGGGNNDFPNLITAANTMAAYGISGPVTFNIYNGTYNGQVELPVITGSSATNTITFRAATGQSPVITNTIGTTIATGACFRIVAADYITIQGLEITNCYYSGIYNYYAGTDSASHNRFIGNYIHNVGTGGSYHGIYMYRAADCEVIGNEIEGDYYGIYNYYGSRNLIANNMVYGVGYYGIYAYYGNYNLYYYNSLYVSCTYGVYHYSSTSYVPSTFKNNIIYQYGTGYVLYCGTSTVPLPTSDFNDWYAPTGNVGYWGSAQNTLTAWQTTTGLDANSISADPNFVGLTDTPDLHISLVQPSPVDGEGVAVAEVTQDFDGETRNATRPDIGADEFTFTVMDYCVDLAPNSASTITSAGSTIDYIFLVNNCGSQNDTYNLAVTVTGAAWTHEIRDHHGSNVISSIAVNAGIIDSFMVRVLVSPTAPLGAISQGRLVALSQHAPGRNIYSDTSYTTTTIPPFQQIALNWVEIAGTAGGPGINANIVGDDVNAGPFPIGFAFPFYNCDTFETIRLCSNGWASFTSTVTAYSNVAIPATAEPNNLLAPYWDDFTTSSQGSVWYYYDATNSRFIAEWYQVPHLSTGGSYTFEIILYQNGNIVYMYDNITHGTPISCTVGIENSTGTEGIQCTYNGSGPLEPSTGMGIRFVPPCQIVPPVEDLVIKLTEGVDMNNVVLSWSDVGAPMYHIYKSDDPESGFTLLGSTANHLYTDPNAVVGAVKAFYYVASDNGVLDQGEAGTFPPAELRHLFRPTHEETPDVRK